jgi:hypothetical protein
VYDMHLDPGHPSPPSPGTVTRAARLTRRGVLELGRELGRMTPDRLADGSGGPGTPSRYKVPLGEEYPSLLAGDYTCLYTPVYTAALHPCAGA